MSKFSFEDIGSVVATFACGEDVTGGKVVKVTENGTVGLCSAKDKFCGVAMEPRKGGAAVQVKGFVTVSTTGSLTPGWANVEADDNGGVQSSADGGIPVLVVSASENSAVLCL